MIRLIGSLAAGVLFGAGLYVSGMVDPTKVRGFLDITGPGWAPDLMVVMASAILVHVGFVWWILRRGAPLADDHLHLPAFQDVDRRLVIGSALFGVGWSIAGVCPGPATVAVGQMTPSAPLFFAAMVVGMALDRWTVLGARPAPPA